MSALERQRIAMEVLLSEGGKYLHGPWVPSWVVMAEVRMRAGCSPQQATGALRSLSSAGLAEYWAIGSWWKATDAAERFAALSVRGDGGKAMSEHYDANCPQCCSAAPGICFRHAQALGYAAWRKLQSAAPASAPSPDEEWRSGYMEEVARLEAELARVPRLLALTLAHCGCSDDGLGDLIDQDVWSELFNDGLVCNREDYMGERQTVTTKEGDAALRAAVEGEQSE